MQAGYGGWLWRLVKETGHAAWVRRQVTSADYNAGTVKT